MKHVLQPPVARLALYRLCTLLLLLASLAFLEGCASESSATGQGLHAISNASELARDRAHELKVGMSDRQVEATLGPGWNRALTGTYIDGYRFNREIPHGDLSTIAEWQSGEDETGWPTNLLFVLFSDSFKTNATDAFLCSSGYPTPLLDGTYTKSLLSVKRGESVTNLYKIGGVQPPAEYFSDDSGGWRVGFLYSIYGGRTLMFEADAGTGMILSASEVTMNDSVSR